MRFSDEVVNLLAANVDLDIILVDLGVTEPPLAIPETADVHEVEQIRDENLDRALAPLIFAGVRPDDQEEAARRLLRMIGAYYAGALDSGNIPRRERAERISAQLVKHGLFNQTEVDGEWERQAHASRYVGDLREMHRCTT